MRALVLAPVWMAAIAAAAAQVAPQQTPPPAQAPVEHQPQKPPPEDDTDSVTITAMVPVPDVGDGAPYFSPDNLRTTRNEARRDFAEASVGARKCQVEVMPKYFGNAPTLEILHRDEQVAAQSVGNLAERAAKATEAALQSRRDAAEARAAMSVVEATELARQEAVKKFEDAKAKLIQAQTRIADAQELMMAGRERDLTWSELSFREARRGRMTAEDMKEEFANIELHDVKSVEFEDPRKGAFIRVTGTITNRRNAAVSVPAIFVSAVDDGGFALATVKVHTARGASMGAGVSSPFQYDLLPMPDGTQTVVVHFASKASPPPRMSVNAFCGEGAAFGSSGD